jgi:hypothetical protein
MRRTRKYTAHVIMSTSAHTHTSIVHKHNRDNLLAAAILIGNNSALLGDNRMFGGDDWIWIAPVWKYHSFITCHFYLSVWRLFWNSAFYICQHTRPTCTHNTLASAAGRSARILLPPHAGSGLFIVIWCGARGPAGAVSFPAAPLSLSTRLES